MPASMKQRAPTRDALLIGIASECRYSSTRPLESREGDMLVPRFTLAVLLGLLPVLRVVAPGTRLLARGEVDGCFARTSAGFPRCAEPPIRPSGLEPLRFPGDTGAGVLIRPRPLA